jgi:hypothetical protein
MDWLELQHKVRPHREKYFSLRALTAPRIESAKRRDIGEQAKSIDAAIRAISRGGHVLDSSMTEDEKDILAIRLDWADQIASRQSLRIPTSPSEYNQELTEDEVEHLLINQWQNEGRDAYKTLQQQIDSAFPNQTRLKKPGSNMPPQSEPPHDTPQTPDEDFRR